MKRKAKTPFEKLFVRTIKFYDDRKVKVHVHGSTLLNIMRRGDVGPREGVTNDKEINIAVLAEDFTDELKNDIKENYPYYMELKGHLPTPGVFYGEKALEPPSVSQWTLEPGCVFLTRLWKGKSTRFKHHGAEHCVLIPNEFVDDKSKWDKIRIFGIDVFAPTNVEKYLEYYYGDWKKEDLGWHWSTSPNYVEWKEMLQRGEVKC